MRGSELGNLGKPINYFELRGVQGIAPESIAAGGFRANYVAMDEKPDLLQIGLKAQALRFDMPEAIGNTAGAFAQNLWSTELSAGFSHALPSQNEWGLNLTTGSDSDKPFHSLHEMTFSLTGVYRNKVDALHSWIFFINYSPNRAFAPNVPLPGAGYLTINPENHTVLFIGIPFFFAWQPTDALSFRFSYVIPTIVSLEWDYRIQDQVKAYAGFDWVPESWWRADRPDSTSQIIFDRKKALIGLKSPIFDRFYINGYGGFFFDEKLFEGRSVTSSGLSKTSIPNQVAFGADVAVHF